ncbi:MAG: ketoacyl-ACP synthase III [Deltaproteobacteria bacterium]|nr:ketoacyl-ACP synthase III [Deltaproteobacteria bacterium]MBW2019981.1 ketoacyl-ACP synthase III [Deltaproteobacteria bacterium]MBW2075042.1 ketoacyl-ACP synthase III [Deltaproteobacteria bacterium]RLB84037.1 MAG: ketoacyl-ACP synthase III [Deltaproteobacteria bacterium]
MPGIKSIATYCPKNRIDNEELVKKFGFTITFLLEKVGVATRAIADAEETTSDMCCAAAQLLFEKNPEFDPSLVDLLIVCTQNPDYRIPHTSAILQDRLDLSNSVAAFDINLGCSGYLYSLAVCKSLIESLGFKNALLFTADPYSKVLDPDDSSTAPLFGDAATVTWLSNEAENSIGLFSFGTDGSGAESLMIKGGGVKFPFLGKGKDSLQDSMEDPFLRMDGRKICKFVKTTIPEDVKKCLAKNRVDIEEIDYFIFHQASKYIIDSLRKALNLEESKVLCRMLHSGNTVSSSIPAVLQTVLEDDGSGKKIILSGFGVGLSWGSCLLY